MITDATHPRTFHERAWVIAAMFALGILFGVAVMLATDVEPRITQPPGPIEIIIRP